eukprot:scpid72622/ scgid12474/ 
MLGSSSQCSEDSTSSCSDIVAPEEVNAAQHCPRQQRGQEQQQPHRKSSVQSASLEQDDTLSPLRSCQRKPRSVKPQSTSMSSSSTGKAHSKSTSMIEMTRLARGSVASGGTVSDCIRCRSPEFEGERACQPSQSWPKMKCSTCSSPKSSHAACRALLNRHREESEKRSAVHAAHVQAGWKADYMEQSPGRFQCLARWQHSCKKAVSRLVAACELKSLKFSPQATRKRNR